MRHASQSFHTLKNNVGGWWGAIREFLYGLAGYEFSHHALAERGALETLFMVISFGDLIGVPILPPYYSLRLLPYVVPNIASWKRRVLRERVPTDSEEYDLHGV